MKTLNLPFEPVAYSNLELTVRKAEIIHDVENQIDSSLPVYLITWSPDPDELPNVSLHLQHQWLVSLLQQFLCYCRTGCFCLEASSKGNPHYHGWYQKRSDSRCVMAMYAHIKTMIRFGLVKIDRAKSYRIHDFRPTRNSLYYYKKDMVGEMLGYPHTPVTCHTSVPDVRNDVSMFFNVSSRKTSEEVSLYFRKLMDTVDFYETDNNGIKPPVI